MTPVSAIALIANRKPTMSAGMIVIAGSHHGVSHRSHGRCGDPSTTIRRPRAAAVDGEMVT